MGLKTQTILIRPSRADFDPDRFLADVGYEKRRKIGDVRFFAAGSGSIWIGTLGDCIVLYTPFAADFFDEGQAQQEEFQKFRTGLLRGCPQAEIAFLTLNSVVDYWGFAVYRNGVLIRCQHGYDREVHHDEGPRLPAELEYLSKLQRIEDDGVIRYRDPAHGEEYDMEEADLGDELVMAICRSFTGFRLDSREMDNIQGADYWLDDDEAKFIAKEAAYARQTRPWWKFWG